MRVKYAMVIFSAVLISAAVMGGLLIVMKHAASEEIKRNPGTSGSDGYETVACTVIYEEGVPHMITLHKQPLPMPKPAPAPGTVRPWYIGTTVLTVVDRSLDDPTKGRVLWIAYKNELQPGVWSADVVQRSEKENAYVTVATSINTHLWVSVYRLDPSKVIAEIPDFDLAKLTDWLAGWPKPSETAIANLHAEMWDQPWAQYMKTVVEKDSLLVCRPPAYYRVNLKTSQWTELGWEEKQPKKAPGLETLDPVRIE